MAKSIILSSEQGLGHRILQLNWGLVLLIIMAACVGFMALYSAAGGHLDPWADRQIMRFCVAFVGMIIIALIDIRWWYKAAWWFYGIGFAMLLVVDAMGKIGMGAQRWIDLGFMQLQPSELMKIAVILVLARYFHAVTADDSKKLSVLPIPIIVILAPVALVAVQPE